jgi:hypothetical protein
VPRNLSTAASDAFFEDASGGGGGGDGDGCGSVDTRLSDGDVL